MASEVIKLNLIPKGDMPVFHASQFDIGRLITCELYRGDDAYSVPEGYTVELHCRKVDNNIVTMESTSISDNVVIFTSTEQLTACNGKNLCEVAILDEGYRIGTLNFILEVEVDPLKGGINSTSEIHNLETQVEEITTEIVGDNYYNKTEVDNLLDDKADADTVYTKTETDTKLALKADSSYVYTKSQTDILLAGKADVSDLPDMTDYYTKTATDALLDEKANAADIYTKTEVDNKILEVMPVGTESGPIATFDTEIAAPLVNVSCDIVATGGNGTPDNPNPIVGYSSANITRCGVNLWDEVTESGRYNISTGNKESASGYICTSNRITVKEGITYTLVKPIGLFMRVVYYNNDGTFNSSPDIIHTYAETESITIPSGVGYLCFNILTETYGNNISFNYPATDTTYHAYNGQTYTVAFGQTVYGGVLDVTRGKLKPCIEYPSYNGETLSGRWLSSEATYVEGTTPPTGSQVVSLDDYGTDIDLTPEVISAIVGTNNVYSDTNGDTTVQYKDSIQHYIDNHIGG